MFYKNIAHVLQTVTVFVLCSCLRRGLPFEDSGGSELLLAYLTSVMRDHLTQLASDRSDLGICGTDLQQEHDGRLAQSMKDTTALPQELQLWASELMGQEWRNPSRVHGRKTRAPPSHRYPSSP